MHASCVWFGRPYWDPLSNILEVAASLSILLHLVASLLYNNVDFNDNSGGAAPLDTILVVVNCLVLAFFIALTVRDVVNEHFRKSVVSAMSKSIGEVVVSIQKELQKRSNQLDRIMVENVAVDAPASEFIDLELFQKYIVTCLHGSSMVVSPIVSEAVYLVLKSIDNEDRGAEKGAVKENIHGDRPLSKRMVPAPLRTHHRLRLRLRLRLRHHKYSRQTKPRAQALFQMHATCCAVVHSSHLEPRWQTL